MTIGLPVYNGESYIEEAVSSVLDQTFTDFELIISDNGSDDSTPQLLERLASADSRITVVTSRTNRGAGWNFNRVLELASGKYFKWQAHDDVIAPTFLERCIERLEANPSASLAFTGVDIVDEQLHLIEHYDVHLQTNHRDRVVRFDEVVLRYHLCFQVFGLIRTDCLRQTEGMGAYSHADGVLLGHLALLGPLEEIDDVLFCARMHDDQSMKQFARPDGGFDYDSYAVWFDSSASDRFRFPHWRMVHGHRRTVWQVADLTAMERARCELVLLKAMRQRSRGHLGDIRRALLHFGQKVRSVSTNARSA